MPATFTLLEKIKDTRPIAYPANGHPGGKAKR